MKLFLDRLQADLHQTRFLSSDPLEFVHRYTDPWDQEAVALVAGLLAYGNVKQIRRSVEDLLTRMKTVAPGPAAYVRLLGKDRVRAERAVSGFVHRFNRGPDVALLLGLLEESWRQHGSLGAHFLKNHEPDAPDFSLALNALIDEWLGWAKRRGRLRPSFTYFLTAPRDGSCCKRWCMFLRWMGRKDQLDPGLWTAESPLARTFPAGRSLRSEQLVIPLDTHTGRISQYLGLTRRKTLNWEAAREVTAGLKDCDATDPVRYDFALARLGILDLCQRKYRKEICEKCQLQPACKFAAKRRPRV